jgi:hypothetical protein
MRNAISRISGALLIAGSAIQTLALSGPAMAAGDGGYGTRHLYRAHYGRLIHRMPVQDSDYSDANLSNSGNGDWDRSGDDACARNPIRALCLDAN